MARHFQKYPGTLNIRKGPVDNALYEARVAQVTQSLVAAGVAANSIQISDGMPGGSGISSERVVCILQKPSQTSTTTRPGNTRVTGP